MAGSVGRCRPGLLSEAAQRRGLVDAGPLPRECRARCDRRTPQAGLVGSRQQGPGREVMGLRRQLPRQPAAPSVVAQPAVRRDESAAAGDAVRKRYWLMPRFAIFDSSVCRGIPSFAAAPDGPEIRPRLSASAASMISLSCSGSKRANFRSDVVDRGDGEGISRVSHSRSTDNVFPSHNTTARSMMFCSSRMLPGQLYA